MRKKAGAVLGATLGMSMIFVLWFVVLASALLLGLFLKKSSIVEHGPTKPLAQATEVIVETLGEIEVSCDPVEQQIMDAFRALAPYGYQNFTKNIEWTLGVTGIIGAIGWRNECSVGFKSNQANQNFIIGILREIQKNLNYTLYDPEKDKFVCPQYFGEFLYDVVWLKYEIDYNKKHLSSADEFTNHYDRFKLIDSPLVCESEWGDFDEIKEDFEKLFLTRSKYRIMVFSVIDQNQFNQYITKLTELILQYQSRQSGDRYLFCGRDKSAKAFRFAQFIVP